MTTIRFRTLIIDDDPEMLSRIVDRLRGMKSSSGSRTVSAELDSLLVRVEKKGSDYFFTEETLRALMEKTRNEYDYLVIDYAYTSPNRQAKQWNEGGAQSTRLTTSDHLLTVPMLKEQLLAFDASQGGGGRTRIERFFNRRVRVLMRSFQHDRTNDRVGPYSARVEATRGVFPHYTQLDELDGFSLIYGSEPELREKFYQGATDGRRLYRYAASSLTVRFYQAAMEHHLAVRANRLVLTRGALSVSTFVVILAALSSLVQALVGPALSEIHAQNWPSAALLAGLTFAGVLGGSFAVAWLAEHGWRRLATGPRDHGDDD